MSSSRKKEPDLRLLSANSRIVQPTYLEGGGSKKKELVVRLKQLIQVLQEDETIDHDDSQKWPGLAATATLLLQYLTHKDKQVRLLSLVACLELLTIYAPHVPYSENELLQIFRQMICQLANLSHATSSQHAHYAMYVRILHLLADVRMGALLVELCKEQQARKIRRRRQSNSQSSNSTSDPESDSEEEDDKEYDEPPLDVLTDLFHTLLSSVRIEHAPQVVEKTEMTLTSCLEEYHMSSSVPIPLLDELLLCIAQGPTQWVTKVRKEESKSSSGKKKVTARPVQVEQANPSFTVAAHVLKTSANRISTSIAQLLNGILNGAPHIVDQTQLNMSASTTSREDGDSNMVHDIIYHLHGIIPSSLTTVIGTVSQALSSIEDGQRRKQAVQLLGRLFVAPGSTVANEFQPCFREWLRRHLDRQVDIRRMVCQYCVKLLQHYPADAYVRDQVTNTLIELCHDPQSPQVRMDVIFQVCDFAFRPSKKQPPGSERVISNVPVPAKLLAAVGSRVQSKNKDERKNAVTGLAQVYFRRYIQPKLREIHQGGDDCDLDVILHVLRDNCHLHAVHTNNNKKKKVKHLRAHGISPNKDDYDVDPEVEAYAWIPRTVFRSACFTDDVDTDMHSRVIQIIDEVLLGSELSSNASKKLTSTARAVGLTIVLHSLVGESENGSLMGADGSTSSQGSSDAMKFFYDLFGRRAKLQKAVSKYIDARAKIRECATGTEEALVANATALELLDEVAALTAPAQGSTDEVLEAFHGARDNHIFRILATITDPLQKPKSRARALEELPKRIKHLGDQVSTWVKSLARRCNMGDFVNADVIGHCVLLAQECFFEKDIAACSALLSSVKVATAVFPSLCAPTKTYTTLSELLSDVRSSHGTLREEADEVGLVTTLSSILSAAAQGPAFVDKSSSTSADNLQSELVKLCTRDGTPEQAKNAVYTLVRLLVPDREKGQTPKGFESPQSTQSKKGDTFHPLLKALTSPSKMTLEFDADSSGKIVSILSALAALADCVPEVFTNSERGRKAIHFAMETVLLGRNSSSNGSDSEEDSADEAGSDVDANGPERRSRSRQAGKRSTEHVSPEAGASFLEDANLSISCRRLCAAMELLTSYVRGRKLGSLALAGNSSQTDEDEEAKQLLLLLSQILRDKGLPPSNRDRRDCKARQERAALRQSAAVNILRLCDGRLGLERQLLSVPMWHQLAEIMLDEERVVREAFVQEFALFLKGGGVYSSPQCPARAPSLRFVALICLCSDGDHGQENDAANGNAANLGKGVNLVKKSVLDCVDSLRRVCDSLYVQCRAQGREAEKKFDKLYKTQVMAEYMVPFAIHLLCHRRETPSEASKVVDVEDDASSAPAVVDDDSQHRVLRKRLKLLFEPLVRSLGDSADNISFLLRMTEIIGKGYRPVDILHVPTKVAPSPPRLSVGSDSSMDTKPDAENGKRENLLEARLKTVCSAAREVLLSYVKKDVDLETYPGVIQIKESLFKKARTSKKISPTESINLATLLRERTGKLSNSSQVSDDKSKSSPEKSAHSKKRSLSRERSPKLDDSAKKSRVHFSPDVQFRKTRQTPRKDIDFGGVSPIPKSTPSSMNRSSDGKTRSIGSAAETLGSSPPSAMRISTFQSTAPSPSSDHGGSPELNRSSQGIGARSPSDAGSGALADIEENEVQSSFSSAGSQSISRRSNRHQTSKSQELSLSRASNADTETSGMLTTSSKGTSRPSKRMSKSLKDKLPSAKRRRSGSVPLQIKVRRAKGGGDASSEHKHSRMKMSKTKDYALTDDTASENEPQRKANRRSRPKKGTKVSTTKPTSLKTRKTRARS